MAKKAYIGVSSKARKVKKIYIGVSGKARKVKKGYIGVGGKARLFFSGSGEVAKYNVMTIVGRGFLAATHVGNYAIFGGGNGGDSTADGFNTSLTYFKYENLSYGRAALAATTVGGYALFGGGSTSGRYGGPRDYVDHYDQYRTHGYMLSGYGLSEEREELAATTVGSYALFGGGDGNSSLCNTVDSYNGSLTHGTTGDLVYPRQKLAATTVGSYALFGGGCNHNSTGYSYMDAYNSSLTKNTSVSSLSYSACSLAATHVGNYAIFAGGGNDGYSTYKTVNAYNSSLTRSIVSDLSVSRTSLAATAIGEFALFGGGGSCYTGGSGNTYKANVDTYDTSLTKGVAGDLIDARTQLAATTVGNYAIFGGGYVGSVRADIYTVA